MITFAMQVVVMGVAGSGKTTVGKALAGRLDLPFFDADDFHSEANKAKMVNGIALTDADRSSWLDALAKLLQDNQAQGQGLVLAASCLKKNYRTQLFKAKPEGIKKAGEAVEQIRERAESKQALINLIYLESEKEEIMQRLASRKDHFFPSSLIESQFQTLEVPEPEENENINLINIPSALNLEAKIALAATKILARSHQFG
ncbi:MAG: gluconokinase [Candidatus Melainabacteria bacterium]|nr:gluconokinase [Candidatus Melainabacteria bacterium]